MISIPRDLLDKSQRKPKGHSRMDKPAGKLATLGYTRLRTKCKKFLSLIRQPPCYSYSRDVFVIIIRKHEQQTSEHRYNSLFHVIINMYCLMLLIIFLMVKLPHGLALMMVLPLVFYCSLLNTNIEKYQLQLKKVCKSQYEILKHVHLIQNYRKLTETGTC